MAFLHEMDEMFHRRIPEVIIPGKPLGRHAHWDPRNRNHPAELASGLKSVTHKSWGLPLNQAVVGSCTAEAACGTLNTVPHSKPGDPRLAQRDAYHLYSLEQQLMGYGPYPPNDNGGSGTQVCQAAKNAGMMSAYQHAFGIDQALTALVLRPVMTGINWYTSFDSPAPASEYIPGLVEIPAGATIRGGHEVFAIALNVVQGLVWFVNSWDLEYGVTLPAAGIQGGAFCMTFQTWERLLQEQGDVTIPRTAQGYVNKPIAA